MKLFADKWEDQAGTAFFVQGWEAENREPKALVVLLHGLGEHTGRYHHVGKALTNAGYALAGFDLRGHGRSGGARGHAASLDTYMQDILQFFYFLQERYSAIPHFLYGHSLGGLLALAYALQHGAGLRGVIVTGAALRSALQNQRAKITVVRLLGSLLPTLALPSGLDPTTLSRDLEVVNAYKNDPLVHDRASLGFGKAALRAIELSFARAADFPLPLLMIHGKEDRITYPSGSADFAKRVGEAGGDVTLKLWDDLYHEVHNEPEQAMVFTHMIDWLDRRLHSLRESKN